MIEVTGRPCFAEWNPVTRSSVIHPLDINPPTPKGRAVSWSFPRSTHHRPSLGPKIASGSTVDRSGAKTIAPTRFRRVRSSFVEVLLLAMLPGPSQTRANCRSRLQDANGGTIALGSDQPDWPKRSRRSPRRRRSRYADIATPRRPLDSHSLFQRVQISGLVRLGPACRRCGTCWPTRIER